MRRHNCMNIPVAMISPITPISRRCISRMLCALIVPIILSELPMPTPNINGMNSGEELRYLNVISKKSILVAKLASKATKMKI